MHDRIERDNVSLGTRLRLREKKVIKVTESNELLS